MLNHPTTAPAPRECATIVSSCGALLFVPSPHRYEDDLDVAQEDPEALDQAMELLAETPWSVLGSWNGIEFKCGGSVISNCSCGSSVVSFPCCMFSSKKLFAKQNSHRSCSILHGVGVQLDSATGNDSIRRADRPSIAACAELEELLLPRVSAEA